MTKRDFFIVLIRIFGLYSLILTLFSFFPSNIAFIAYPMDLSGVFWILGMTLVLILIYYFVIQKAGWIVDTLRLDRGFDDEQIVVGNFNAHQILCFAIVVIGGLVLLFYGGSFLQYCLLAFKEKVGAQSLDSLMEDMYGQPVDYLDWGISALNVVIGYLLITQYSKVARWIHRKEAT